MQPANRKLKMPAFGHAIVQLRIAGLVPIGYFGLVLALDNWNLGRCFHRIVIPPDDEPASINYAVVAGLDVSLVWLKSKTPIERCDSVIRNLLAVHPASLRVIDFENPELGFWIVSRMNGLERLEFAS